MNPQQEAVALWKFFEERGRKPKVASIIRILRYEYRLKFRDGDISRWLSNFSGRGPAETRSAHKHENPRRAESGVASARSKVSLPSTSSSDKSSEAPDLFGNEGTKVTPISRKRRTAEKDTSWRAPLVASAQEISNSNRPMSRWSVDERFTWARWHCLMFGNCTADEGRNKTKASDVAAGLASMALSRDYGTVTGHEYFLLAKAIHEQRNAVPWFDPWLIKGAMEVAEA